MVCSLPSVMVEKNPRLTQQPVVHRETNTGIKAVSGVPLCDPTHICEKMVKRQTTLLLAPTSPGLNMEPCKHWSQGVALSLQKVGLSGPRLHLNTSPSLTYTGSWEDGENTSLKVVGHTGVNDTGICVKASTGSTQEISRRPSAQITNTPSTPEGSLISPGAQGSHSTGGAPTLPCHSCPA